VVMRIVFWVPRPNTHFIASRRGPGRLRPQFQDPVAFLPNKRLDVDNLAKFVLDALNGLLYSDDSQVILLQAVKLHDSTDSCNGRTEVQVWSLRQEDLQRILQSPYRASR
jgi:Holliday junction resolvase RusA-like endonuclease